MSKPNFSKAIRLLRQEFFNFRTDLKKRQQYSIGQPTDDSVLDSLRQQGFCVLPGFFSQEQCTVWRDEIDLLLQQHPEKSIVDGAKSDHRVYAADRLSPSLTQFYRNEQLWSFAEDYERINISEGFTLAARLEARESNLGSGGGWHRDSAAHRQTKAIVYLSDVSLDSGPFQYLEGSHQAMAFLKDSLVNDRQFNQLRFSENEVAELVDQNPTALKTLQGKAGDVILVDTRGIHRGAPIQKGTRYALTNYWWFDTEMPEHMLALLNGTR